MPSVRTLVLLLGASALAGYAFAVTSVGLSLDPPNLAAAFAQGSILGAPVGAFVFTFVVATLLGLVVASLSLGAPRPVYGVATPGGRVLVALTPLLATPMALAQDDLARRPPILAALVASSLALGSYGFVRAREASGEPELAALAAPSGWRGFAREHGPVLVAIVLHATLFSALAVLRDQALWSASVDLGIFKEALWNTLHGRVMHSPTVGYSFLGEHFAPVLFLLVPLYALWPSSACLLIVQTLAVSAAAWPVYLLGRDLKLGRALATALAAAMLFSPPMHTALLYDFHMDLLGVPALAGLALAVHRRRYGLAALCLALLVSVKEDMFIPGGAVLAARFFSGDARDRKASAALAVAAVVYCLLAMVVILPRFGPPPGVPVYMSDGGAPGGYKFLRNFRHLAGPPGPLLRLLGQPVRFALYALTEARLSTLLGFVLPVALLPFAAGWRVALLAPLGIVLLSDNSEIVALRYHYSAIQHPGVYLAAVYGAAAVLARSAHPTALRAALTTFVVGAAAVMAMTHPSSMAARTHAHDARRVTPHVRAVDRLVARIPPLAPVSIGTFLGPRVSNRPMTALFPNALSRVEWALVDLQRPPWPAGPEQRDDILRGLLRSDWGAVAWEDGAILLRRRGDTGRNLEAVRDLFVRRRYEVEGTEQTDFPNCSESVPGASDTRARVVRATDPRPPGFVVFGPFLRLPMGRYRVTFRLRSTDVRGGGGELGEVDVFVRPGRPVAARALTPEVLPEGAWRDVVVPFEVGPGGYDGVEFRVRTSKRGTLAADVISLAADDEDAVVRGMMGL